MGWLYGIGHPAWAAVDPLADVILAPANAIFTEPKSRGKNASPFQPPEGGSGQARQQCYVRRPQDAHWIPPIACRCRLSEELRVCGVA